MKICTKCKFTFDESNFSKDVYKKDGLRPSCKSCGLLYNAKETARNRRRAYRQTDKCKKQSLEHRSKPEVKQRIHLYQKEYLSKPEKAKHRKEYYAKPEVRQRVKEYNRERLKDPHWKLSATASRSINKSLKSVGGKKHRHWEDIVNYTLKELREHLEKLFKDGMTWENYEK